MRGREPGYGNNFDVFYDKIDAINDILKASTLVQNNDFG
jgi:hypothetical protein